VTARVPPEALALLDTLLDSFEKLELAWHLERAGGPVRRAELQAALQLEEDSMREVIAELLAAKIIEVSGGPEPKVRLGPRARREDFSSLMALYAEDRLAVVAALSSIAMRRIRTMAARTFAEAFVLKRSKKGDDD
jgi:hypothetical protein